jgi:hypothetical protein
VNVDYYIKEIKEKQRAGYSIQLHKLIENFDYNFDKLSELCDAGLEIHSNSLELEAGKTSEWIINNTHYIDFTSDRWLAFPLEQQIYYSQQYQIFYVEKVLGIALDHKDEGVEYTLIPPNLYYIGSPDSEQGRFKDEQQHKVLISRPLWVSKYPAHDQNKRPVTSLTLDESIAWAKERGATLLTEAQWESACRAGTATPFFCKEEDLPKYALFDQQILKEDEQVGRRLPNPWGLYDMAGYAWERCLDYYNEVRYKDLLNE